MLQSVNKAVKKVVKKTAQKGGKIKAYRKSAQGIINRGIKSGYEDLMIEKFGTLDVNVLIKSKKGLDKLKNEMKYIRQIPKIQRELKAYEEKVERKKLIKEAKQIAKEQLMEVRDTYGRKAVVNLQFDRTYRNLSVFEDFADKNNTSDDIRLCIHEMKTVPAIVHAENLMSEQVESFFEEYFKELRLNAKDRPKIEQLKSHFKGNLVEYNDFVQYVTNPSFAKDYDSDSAKNDVQSYEEEMRDRLHRMCDLVKKGTYK